MTDLERAVEAFRQVYGFDPMPDIKRWIHSGDFDLVGGTEEQRAVIRDLLTGDVEP